MENDLIKADKEIDALKAKLAKAVEAALKCRVYVENAALGDHMYPDKAASDLAMLDATLAEIEGEKT
jgi:hypothetical protein